MRRVCSPHRRGTSQPVGEGREAATQSARAVPGRFVIATEVVVFQRWTERASHCAPASTGPRPQALAAPSDSGTPYGNPNGA
ncbi:unnamed protein product [Leptosia nina]|uniref:Uncharacterized protein n=1 Tax=Leptosia nina TaxID=320188 RepID=A0AAV1JIJ6_9NEOP